MLKDVESQIIQLLIIISLLLICFLLSCSGEVETYTDPQEMINTGVDREFIVAVVSEPAKGFEWSAAYDEGMLELVQSTYETREEGKKDEAEVSLEQHFRFKALRKGETEITLEQRPGGLEYVIKRRVFQVNIE
jgi:predicted secreted protein